MDKQKTVAIKISNDLWWMFKLLALQKDKKVSEYLAELVKNELDKNLNLLEQNKKPKKILKIKPDIEDIKIKKG